MQRRAKSTLCVLTSVLLLNLVLRYPSTSHELGVDSFVFHAMAASIQRFGAALWILNPLSYLGFYPLSHPGGGPFLVAATSDLTGVSIEGSILVLDLVVAITGALGGFLLGLDLTQNDRFALLLAAVFSLTPAMIGGLTWQMPTRIMFTTLLPLFLSILVRLARRPQWQHVFLGVALLFLMASFHRLTVLVSLVALSYLFTGIFVAIHRTLRVRRPKLFLRPGFVRRAPVLAVLTILGIMGGTLGLTNVLSEYSTGVIASGDSTTIRLLNLGVSLARSSGLLLPLAFLGVFAIAVKKNKDLKEPLMILAFVTFTPMLFLRDYTGYYTVPFTSVFVTYGIYHISRRVHPRKLRIAAVAFIVGFMVLSSTAIARYNVQTTTGMSSETYTVALYVKYTTSGTVVFNEGLIGARVDSIALVPYLPVGGATTAFQSPELLIYGFVNRSVVLRQIYSIPLSQLSVDSDSPYELVGVQAEADWAYMLLSPVSDIPVQYAHYDAMYVMESKWLEGRYTAYGNIYPSTLLLTARVERYVTFQDAYTSMYCLG